MRETKQHNGIVTLCVTMSVYVCVCVCVQVCTCVPMYTCYFRRCGQGSLVEEMTFELRYDWQWDFPDGSVVKSLPANAGEWVLSLGLEDSLEKEIAILPGKSHGWRSLTGYSLWVQRRVEHDLVTKQ